MFVDISFSFFYHNYFVLRVFWNCIPFDMMNELRTQIAYHRCYLEQLSSFFVVCVLL